jgi:hypothetical protein
MINYLTTFSGHNINTNNLIEKVYNYINKFLPDTYLIVIVTYYQIYFQLIDKLFEKYVLLQNKAYTTSMLFCFHYDKLNNNKLMFEHESKEYEFNDDNLSKIIKLYKKNIPSINKYKICIIHHSIMIVIMLNLAHLAIKYLNLILKQMI